MINLNKFIQNKNIKISKKKFDNLFLKISGNDRKLLNDFKDLKKIEYVSVNEKQVQEGVIQYATMNQIQNILPFSGKDWGLSAAGKKDLADIKKFISS